MSWLRKTLSIVVGAVLCASALAQDDGELKANMREAEAHLLAQEAERAAAEVEREAAKLAELAQTADERNVEVEVEVRMREAERRLAEAAQQVAELSMAQLPRIERLERVIRTKRGPVLGVTIGDNGGNGSNGPVAGVEIIAVSPGGAAADAGLRAGDVMTSVNGEELTAENGEDANAKLLDFMEGVEEGDTLDIEYLRNGRSATTELSPRPINRNVFTFGFDGEDFVVPDAPFAPNAPNFRQFSWTTGGHGFGDMELVKLTERLGEYFGADDGLLVVRAPEEEYLQLEDGDVILNIDGRKPTSVAHAMRILSSYESGETLKIEIMRDKRKRSISMEIPDNNLGSQRSHNSNGLVPVPDVQIAPRARIVVVE